MARWIFVRHAQSLANAGGWFSGHTDVGLSDKGREQGLALAVALADEPIQRAFSSDLRRAYDTAVLGLGPRGLTVVQTPLLRERDMGEWTGRPIAELEPLGLQDVLHGWTRRPPAGESMRDTSLRAMRFLAGVEDGDGSTLVVAHGGLLRGVLGLIDGLAESDISRRIVANTEICAREIPPETFARLLTELEA